MRLAAFALLPAVVCAADLKIDHVTIAGKDIHKLQAGLSAAGMSAVYGGTHANGVTEMALVSFPDGSYLEFIGLQPKADPKAAAQHEWAPFLTGSGMPCAWALQSADLAADGQRLKAAGVEVTPAARAGRRRPDGTRLEWETVNLGAAARGTFFPFLIHDLTPRPQRAFPQGKPVTADFQGVALVVVAVRNLDAAVERYRKAFALPAAARQVDREFGAQLARMGDAPVVLAQPLTADSWIAARIARFGEGPCAFVLRSGSHPPERSHLSQSRWFGRDIAWFDPAQLGWQALGLAAEEK